jgi:[pyruvate, water dikinase]-phosphate phosphotransferase / [pyruvate, water dikinase] kinase
MYAGLSSPQSANNRPAEGTLRLHLHLVSDSTGETVTTVARAGVSQFEGVMPVEHVWSFVRTRAQVDQVLSMVKALPGVVIFTLVSPDLRQALLDGCRALNTPCVAILDGVLGALSNMLGAESRPQVGRQHALDAGYFSRIDAMTFMFHHDDGQCAWELEQADVVLVGVSRTSKTPTSIYLANRGIKVANVPVVPDCPLPAELESLSRPLVIGLTISPEPLVQIRMSRLRQLRLEHESDPGGRSRFEGDYAELERVRAELVYARRLFTRYGWPVIDVTRRSVEETAAAIFQLMQARRVRENAPTGVTETTS